MTRLRISSRDDFVCIDLAVSAEELTINNDILAFVQVKDEEN
jgi:hypothetical protein